MASLWPLTAWLTPSTFSATPSTPTTSGPCFITCPRPKRMEREIDGHLQGIRPSFDRPTSHRFSEPKLKHSTLFTPLQSDSMWVFISVKAISSRSTTLASFTPVMGSSFGARRRTGRQRIKSGRTGVTSLYIIWKIRPFFSGRSMEDLCN